MMKKYLLPTLFSLVFPLDVAMIAIDEDVTMWPLLLLSAVLLALWKFAPAPTSPRGSRSAFRGLVAFGLASVALSFFLSAFVPPNAAAWGVDVQPADANGIIYPIVNDGRENCLFATAAFLSFFAAEGLYRLRARRAAAAGGKAA